MKNVVKVVLLFFAVSLMLSAMGCRSLRVVERDSVVSRVVERTFNADSMVRKSAVSRHDSAALSVMRMDSVVEHTVDSVREVLMLDSNGRVVQHGIWRNSVTSRDKWQVNSHKEQTRNIAQSKDSVAAISKMETTTDSTLLKAGSKITDSHGKQPKQTMKSKVTAFFQSIGMVVVFLLLIGVVSYGFYRINEKQ